MLFEEWLKQQSGDPVNRKPFDPVAGLNEADPVAGSYTADPVAELTKVQKRKWLLIPGVL